MRFKMYLEEIEKDQRFWTQFFTGLWDVSPGDGGLGMNLAGFDTDRLKGTSEFQALDPRVQGEILSRVAQGNGTIGDLVNIAAGSNGMVGTF